MGQSQFILFQERWAEDQYWGQQLDQLSGASLFVREAQRPQVLMDLCRAWERETGKQATYWIGSLWDVPIVRAALQRLQDEPQIQVLQELVAKAPSQNESIYYKRDLEAWRCFVEMLEPLGELLGLEAWRELSFLCRSTILEYGQWPWDLKLLTEHTVSEDPKPLVCLPYCYQTNEPWPDWLFHHAEVRATAAQYDKRQQKQRPDFALQTAAAWTLCEAPELEIETEVTSAACPGPLVDPKRIAVWQASREQHVYSASELELYARSPYAYYCERVLRLMSHQEESWDLNPLETGLVVHRVLERYYQKQSPDDLMQSAPDFNLASTFITEEIEATLSEREPLSHFLIERQQEKIQRAVHAVLAKDHCDMKEQHSPLIPTYFEWTFGEGAVPPLEIPGHDGKVILLRGKIDRIDVDHDKKTFMVIDYKTGGSKITGADIQNGRSLQLPLYIQAVKQHLLPDYDPIGGMFFSLADMSKKDGLLRLDYIKDYFDISLRSSSLMSPKKWQQAIDDSFELIADIVQALEAGEFSLCEELCASYCEFQNMCGWSRT